MTSHVLPVGRVRARLPSGELFDPGAVPAEGIVVCSGPNSWGACPFVLAGKHAVCRGAQWFYENAGGEHAWEYVFQCETAACPVSILDPLGPSEVPAD